MGTTMTAATAMNFGGTELLQIADAVAREKGLQREFASSHPSQRLET